MRKDLEQNLYEETLSEVAEMGNMELGSNAHVKTAKVVNDTIDRLNEAKRIENQSRQLDIEAEKNEIEREKNEIEREKIANEKRFNKIKTVGSWILFIATTGVTIWANKDSKRFEEGYTHTTEAGKSSTRNLLNLMDKFKFN